MERYIGIPNVILKGKVISHRQENSGFAFELQFHRRGFAMYDALKRGLQNKAVTNVICN
jgi:hypothetical protein